MIPSSSSAAEAAVRWVANRAIHTLGPPIILTVAGTIVVVGGLVALYGATCKAGAEILAKLRRFTASP